MGRVVDFLILMIAIFGILVVQSSAAMILDPMRDEILEEEMTAYDGDAEADFAGMFAVVTKWAPTTGLLGLIMLIAYREYRRQRVAGRGVRR